MIFLRVATSMAPSWSRITLKQLRTFQEFLTPGLPTVPLRLSVTRRLQKVSHALLAFFDAHGNVELRFHPRVDVQPFVPLGCCSLSRVDTDFFSAEALKSSMPSYERRVLHSTYWCKHWPPKKPLLVPGLTQQLIPLATFNALVLPNPKTGLVQQIPP